MFLSFNALILSVLPSIGLQNALSLWYSQIPNVLISFGVLQIAVSVSGGHVGTMHWDRYSRDEIDPDIRVQVYCSRPWVLVPQGKIYTHCFRLFLTEASNQVSMQLKMSADVPR